MKLEKMELTNLGFSFGRNMHNVIKKADGFSDRLAIYKDDTNKYYKIECVKKPTDKQIILMSNRVRGLRDNVYLNIVYPTGVINLSINGVL